MESTTDSIRDKGRHSMALISAFTRQAAASGGRIAIATSFGKDSMVLLHLVAVHCLEEGIPMPDCVCFKEPFEASKYRWGQDMAERMGLTVYDWRPSATAMQQEGTEFEVQNYYRFGPRGIMTCPTGIVPPQAGRPFRCAMEDFLNKPKAPPLDVPWTHWIIGHKGTDSDPIYGGDAGTRVEWRIVPGVGEFLFPLRDWTDADIWAFSAAEGVPQNAMRYKDGKQDMDDLRWNPDFFHACTACLDRRPEAPRFVPCPRRAGAVIENISARVPWADQSKPTYMED